MSKIIGYLLNMIPYMLIAIPIIIIFRIIFIIRLKKKGFKTNIYHEVGLCLFIMFLVGLASQTFIPKLEFGNSAMAIVNGNLLGEMNLIPGKVFVDSYRECFQNGYYFYFVVNVIGNICLFVPIGFCVPLLWEKVSANKIVLIALCSSIIIEVCQYPQARGTDIDDIWINILGALIGYVIFMFLSKKIPAFMGKFKVVCSR
jgi:Glycopeptide antibiotics resistance protein